MEEKTNNLTTVAYSKSRSKELSSICKKLGLSKAQFIDATIHQYYRTGEDPREPIKDSLPKKLTAIENKIIGFIKTQDTKYLQALLDKLQNVDNAIFEFSHAIETIDRPVFTGSNDLIKALKQELEDQKKKDKERWDKIVSHLVQVEKRETARENKHAGLIEFAKEGIDEKRKKAAADKIEQLRSSLNTKTISQIIDIINEM